MRDEKYVFTYEDIVTGSKVTREFYSDDLDELAYNILEFTRSVGFSEVDMLEFTSPEGNIYRAELP